MQSTSPFLHTPSLLGKIIVWSGLVASWILLFGMLVVASWSLNPYDAVPLQRIPQSGWEHTLYNILVLSNLRIWIVIAIPVLSIVWFTWLYFQARPHPNATTALLRRFTGANVVCVLAMSLLNGVVAFLPLHLTPPPGFGYTMKFIVKDILILIVWGLYLARLKESAV